MRILMTTLASEGHLRPLLPFADAFRDLGHDVLIAIPESGAERVHGAGHDAWELADPPAAAVEAVFSRAHAAASPDEANAIVIGEAFAGVYARASLPGVMAATAEWLPDLLMPETCEFAAALTAERAGLPSVRLAIHMRELERYIAELAAPEVDALRAEQGLAADSRGERLSAGPSVTLIGRVRDAVSALLEDHAYARRATEIAAEVATLPPVADSIEILRRLQVAFVT